MDNRAPRTRAPRTRAAPRARARTRPITYDSVDALAAACGASRLDGGMHFTGAVAAGEALCAGIGTAGFEYASELIGGEW